MQKWSPNELPPKLSDAIIKVCGKFSLSDKNAGANKILHVRELDERETSIVKSNQMVQTLYKFTGTINFFKFNRAVDMTVARNEIMRSNYIIDGDDAFAVIFNGRDKLPEIVCQNVQKLGESEIVESLQRLMDADKRRAFDLKKNIPLRMTILHTAPTEYLILITMSQLLNEKFSIGRFLNEALEIEQPSVDETKSAHDSDRLLAKPQIEASIREYWAKILTELPIDQQLPYYKPSPALELPCVYRAVVSYDIASEIRRRAQSNRLMLISILQTAWGLMIQNFNRSTDAAYCSLMPSRDRSMAFSTIPIRLKADDDVTIAQLVNAQFQQLLVSQPYSRFDWSALEELPGTSTVFNHFLSFVDFAPDKKNLSTSDSEKKLRLVTQKFWNATDSRLGVHFYDDEDISIVLKYDESWLAFNEAMLLMRQYLSTLSNMMADWALPTAKFQERLSTQFGLQAGEAPVETERSKMQDIISKIGLLRGLKEGTLKYFFKVSRLDTRFEGDRISDEEMSDAFIVVTDGMIARNIDTGDGWFNMLDMVVEGLPLNEVVLLDERRCKLSAEVVSESATLLIVSLDEMKKILNQTPRLWQNIAQHALSAMENYQSIWVQA